MSLCSQGHESVLLSTVEHVVNKAAGSHSFRQLLLG